MEGMAVDGRLTFPSSTQQRNLAVVRSRLWRVFQAGASTSPNTAVTFAFLSSQVTSPTQAVQRL